MSDTPDRPFRDLATGELMKRMLDEFAPAPEELAESAKGAQSAVLEAPNQNPAPDHLRHKN